ncbi:MAG: alpha/beta fold hydrolase [Deltaproteobacteria bacterium]|nr:alpha/beta fold hydrolase [Deltaproteobacteria bacterium]
MRLRPIPMLLFLFSTSTLADAHVYAAHRKVFKNTLHQAPAARTPAPKPPDGVLELVHYPAPLGQNAAYVTPVQKGPKRPAIVWLHGGFDWSIGELAWAKADRENDQSGRAFREAGMVELLPSYRGCNDNPGEHEFFLGEVDDVLAAIDFVKKRPDVDPERVYLGGHSTGGTLALLAAASGAPVRGVFALGPAAWIKFYRGTGTALDNASQDDRAIRSPAMSVSEITAPTFVIEGEDGLTRSFAPLQESKEKAPLTFIEARGHSHFSIIAPATELIAKRLMAEAGGGAAFTLTQADLSREPKQTPLDDCMLGALRKRKTPADDCLADCFQHGKGKHLGGGCYHVCFAYQADRSIGDWVEPPEWKECSAKFGPGAEEYR